MMKSIAWIILTSLLVELCSPLVSWAITSGPTPPEATSFEPIATTGMVNEFTGGFTYNLPLMDVPGPHGSGYPLSLAYHSNANPEDDATWVGFGWALNPGAITRNMRGVPDDANGIVVEHFNKQLPNETFAIGGRLSTELFSNVSGGASSTARWNTYTGFSMVTGFELDVMNTLSLRMSVRNGRAKFTADVNWAGYFQKLLNDELRKTLQNIENEALGSVLNELSTSANTIGLIHAKSAAISNILSNASEEKRAAHTANEAYKSLASLASSFVTSLYTTAVAPAYPSKFNGTSFVVNFATAIDVSGTPGVVTPLHVGVNGSYHSQTPVESENVTSYGYMYEGNANESAMVDYGVDRVTSYTTRDRYIHSVFNNHDVFSCNAQGLGGTMRLYHRTLAVHAPRRQESFTTNYSLGFNLNVGTKFGLGTSLGFGVSVNGIGGIESTPNRRESVSAYNNNGRATMRFMGDPSGHTRLSGSEHGEAYGVTGTTIAANKPQDIFGRLNNVNTTDNLKRPRSASSITYRTNAEIVGRTLQGGQRPYAYTAHTATNERHLDRTEQSIRDGIGEIATTSSAGVRYIFGLPVYGRNEESFTYTRDAHDTSMRTSLGVVGGGGKRLGITNGSGQRRKAPIASSFLLTEVRTPDYIDRTLDGPTPDDYGGYTYFEYERAYGTVLKDDPNVQSKSLASWYRWRVPYHGFTFDPGSISDPYDDRGSASMGYREQYYLSKIDTKSHTAIFVTNKTNVQVVINGQTVNIKGSGKMRNDAFQAFNHVTSALPYEEWHRENESVTADLPGGHLVNTYLDRDSALRYIGPGKKFTLGGRERPLQKDVTQDFIDEGSAEWRENDMQYLEKIVLLAKSDDGSSYSSIVKTVNFEYDYSLGAFAENTGWLRTTEWTPTDPEKKLPVNRYDSVYNLGGSLNSTIYLSQQHYWDKHLADRVTGCRYGKLTLKRVWTDYGSVKGARIAPYEFTYTYPISSKMKTPSKNEFVLGNGDQGVIGSFEGEFVTPSLADNKEWINERRQNPAYSFWNVDAWGSYRNDGWGADLHMRRHIDQKRLPGSQAELLDAAAWQLKVISLPSGGRIRIHYERNTYSYVQDKRVETLVPLHTGSSHDIKNGTLFVDLDYLAGRNKADVLELLHQKRRDNQALYFKLLLPFAQCGWDTKSDIPPQYGMEYITGYSVANVASENGAARIMFIGDVQPDDVLSEYLDKRNGFPIYCKEGKTRPQWTASPKYRQIGNNKWEPSGRSSKDTWLGLLSDGPKQNVKSQAVISQAAALSGVIDQRSFVRIPCVWKYGGGVRVKRILLEDPGVETGQEALYGTEYDYDMWDANGMRISSGVATNEPATLREDCALTSLMVGRDSKTLLEKMSSGEDIDQMEGPLAFSALPAPSIGYRRVVSKSIVSTISSPGYVISEFYTAKDYPIKETATALESGKIVVPPMPNPVFSAQASRYAASQGFTVVHNTMHGKHRSTKKCRGQYSSAIGATHAVIEESVTEYFEPGERIPVLTKDQQGLKIERRDMGTDVDVAIERRELKDFSISGSIPFDLGVQLPWFPFAHVGIPSGSLSDQRFRFASVTKVVSYLAFERRKVVKKDGMTHIVDNVAFDEATGIPVVQYYFGEQHGNFVSGSRLDDHRLTYVLPAWMHYPQMDWLGYNEGSSVEGSLQVGTSVVFVPSNATDFVYFTPGDYVNIPLGATEQLWAHVVSSTTASVVLEPAYGSAQAQATTGVTATIVRSGRTNQLTAVAGNITELGRQLSIPQTTPLQVGFGSSRIISASATTYSDVWAHEDLDPSIVYSQQQSTPYSRGTRGKWRPVSTYAFGARTDNFTNNATLGRAGSTSPSNIVFALVNYGSPRGQNPNWIKISEVTHYSVHGEPVGQLDALGTPTSATFAHHDAVPSCVARNAEIGTATFLSFEEDATGNSQHAHTGKKSKVIGAQSAQLYQVRKTTRLKAAGLLVRAWIKSSTGVIPSVALDGTALTTGTTIATVSGWRLVEWTATPSSLASSWPTSPTGWAAVAMSASQDVYVDDVRIQPYTAEASCYVYDPSTLRLIAQFDDQHFAVIYKYDAEGRLRRKERETERGIVPLQEHAMNTPTISYKDRKSDEPREPSALRSSSRSSGYPNSTVQDGMDAPFGAIPSPNGMQAKGDLLEIRLTPEKRRWRLFGNEEKDVPPIDSIVGTTVAPAVKDSVKSPGGKK